MSTEQLNIALRADLKSGERIALIIVKQSIPGYYSVYNLAKAAGVAYTTAVRWVGGLEAKGELEIVNGRCYAVEG